MREKNPHFWDLCTERKALKDYQEALMKELNRRETMFGNQVKPDDEDYDPREKENIRKE